MSNDSAPRQPGARPAARTDDTRFNPDSDASTRPEEGTAPEPKPGPFLWCSDCRAAMRTYYYALETRPLCQKCKIPYAAQIARGSGPGALRRVILYGGGAALGCAVLLGIGILAIGYLRVVAAIGVGYAVGRAVNHASGSFFDTRYRIIAAVFTYFAIGLGSLAPVIKAIAEAPEQSAVVASEESDDERRAAAEDPYAGLDLEEIATKMEEDREQALADLKEMPTQEREEAAAAQELASMSFLGLMGSMLVMLVTLPLLANFAYGLYAGVFGAAAMGYGSYKAWVITGETVGVLLSGPHRIGTGPVSQTMGG